LNFEFGILDAAAKAALRPLWLELSSLRSTISVPRETLAPASGFFRLTVAERCARCGSPFDSDKKI
jgi:hypothetical protein